MQILYKLRAMLHVTQLQEPCLIHSSIEFNEELTWPSGPNNLDFEFSTVNQQAFPSSNEGKTYLGLYFELKLL